MLAISKEKLGLSAATNMFFRGCNFELRSNNIFGLSDGMIDEYIAAKNSEDNSKKYGTKKQASASHASDDNMELTREIAQNATDL